jgi:hypothetical protein
MKILSAIAVTFSGLIAMAGVTFLAAGSYGLFAGIHGGPMVASLLILFGAGLISVGYFCGRAS